MEIISLFVKLHPSGPGAKDHPKVLKQRHLIIGGKYLFTQVLQLGNMLNSIYDCANLYLYFKFCIKQKCTL